MPMEWSEKFTSGEQEIDNHHIMLFDFVNVLEDRINDHPNNPMEKEEIAQRLYFLKQYVIVHFEYEENCMFKHRCPAAQQNKAAHDDFIETFTAFMEEFEEQGPTVDLMTSLHTTMSTWLTNHIIHTDITLRHCL
jgi:hemerythrin